VRIRVVIFFGQFDGIFRFGESLATGRAFQRRRQFLATYAHPADPTGRVAHHQGVIRDVFRYDRTGPDEGITAYGDAADDGAVGTQGGAVLDERGPHLVHLSDFGAGVIDVREDHRWAAKDAVFQGYAFVDANVVLYFALFAYTNVGADDNVLADVAVLANF